MTRSRKDEAPLTVWIDRELLARFRAKVRDVRGEKRSRRGDQGPVDVVREFIAGYVGEGHG